MATLVPGFTVSPHHRIAFPASSRQKGGAVFGTFLRNQADAFGVYFEQLSMGNASVFSHVGLHLWLDPRQHRPRQYLLGLRASSADNRSLWTLEELVSRPFSVNYHTEMRIGTARLRKLLSERIRF